MRSAFVIIFVLFTLILVSACGALEFGGDKELDKLADSYGGVYIFDRKLREEIIQREAERKEFGDKIYSMSSTDEEFRANRKKYDVDKVLPQTLSNGCEYFLNSQPKKGNFRFEDMKEFEFYENKMREFMGDKAYKEIRPYLIMSSYYECGGKRYPITFATRIMYVTTSYGLYGDEGAGFRLSQGRLRSAKGTLYFYYLIDGKFVKGEKTKGKEE